MAGEYSKAANAFLNDVRNNKLPKVYNYLINGGDVNFANQVSGMIGM